MALQSSGAITLAQIAAEFGGSTPHSLSEYYGAASGVPASGTISFDDFYGTSSVVLVTRSTNGTNIQLSSEFGSNWAANVAKQYTINSGVTIGGAGNHALTVSSGMGGTLIINNAGEIQGNHGTAGGGGSAGQLGGSAQSGGGGGDGSNGGIAIYVSSGNPTINNTGAIRGGGGGGGGGGGAGTISVAFFGTRYVQGGGGGSGGLGQGYNQSNTNGSSGSSNDFLGVATSTGGTGGNGGTWGNNGGNGAAGTQSGGTPIGSNGSGGNGGSAGAAIAGSSRTLNNSGTINGST